LTGHDASTEALVVSAEARKSAVIPTPSAPPHGRILFYICSTDMFNKCSAAASNLLGCEARVLHPQ
jgi:hypothetical protein